MTPPRSARWKQLAEPFLYWMAAPLLSLAVFWRAPFIWFRVDDFAWLSLPQRVPIDGWWNSLFSPAAQGTVRILSERLYFFTLASLFGVTSWPFRLLAILTWIAGLWLIQAIATRLTGSRNVGLCAALLWAVNANVMEPLAWASGFNEVLIALLMLTAFYARLHWLALPAGQPARRRWVMLEAACFLLGFGVLETVVMYPAWILLHTALDPRTRAQLRAKPLASGLWMLIPAALFTAAHLFLIPKTDSPIYARHIDAQLPVTLWHYLEWTLAPWRSVDHTPIAAMFGLVTWIALAVALGLFCLLRLRARDPLPALCCGWFALWIAPVLPLTNHFTAYYLTVPGIGLAWLCGYALDRALRASFAVKTAAILLALGYAIGSAKHVDTESAWFMDVTGHIRLAARSLENTAAAHPGTTILLRGLDSNAFMNSLPAGLDRLLNVEVWLAPGEDAILTRTDLGDLSRFRTTPEAVLAKLQAHQLRVISIDRGVARDVTAPYTLAQQIRLSTRATGVIDAGQPSSAANLGDGWYPIENNARWSAQRPQVKLQIPEKATTLAIHAFAPDAVLAAGPLHVTVFAQSSERPTATRLGEFTVEHAGDVDVTLPLSDLRGPVTHGPVTLELRLSRTFRPPGDPRDLGLVFGTFALK